ncbi:MAG: type II toxin-antitoxin system RelE family toxin [bacterium]
MASYRIVLKPSVEKDLRSLPSSALRRVWDRLRALADAPHPQESVKLTGTERLYRIRVGNYRIIYGVDNNAKLVTVHYVRHRREVYRGL